MRPLAPSLVTLGWLHSLTKCKASVYWSSPAVAHSVSSYHSISLLPLAKELLPATAASMVLYYLLETSLNLSPTVSFQNSFIIRQCIISSFVFRDKSIRRNILILLFVQCGVNVSFHSEFPTRPWPMPICISMGVQHGRVLAWQEVKRKQLFSPQPHSWYVIGLMPASHQGPFHEVPSRRGGWGKCRNTTIGMEPQLLSRAKQDTKL